MEVWKKDILEADEKQKKRAYDVTKKIAKMYDMKIINCTINDSIKDIEDIQNEILKFVKEIIKWYKF